MGQMSDGYERGDGEEETMKVKGGAGHLSTSFSRYPCPALASLAAILSVHTAQCHSVVGTLVILRHLMCASVLHPSHRMISSPSSQSSS